MDAELTAVEIFDLLLAGKQVGQVSQCSNDPDLVRLLNHLNVIKHRSRKLYEGLGLEWSNSIISVKPKLSEANQGMVVTFSLTTPKAPKKYASFIIIDDNANTN
jgi:hypothetical protein